MLALESTIIAHGMPYPQNLEFAREAEQIALEHGVEPATIAILDGEVCIGLDKLQLERLARGEGVAKVATRDLAAVLASGQSGATTVSATMVLARKAGIQVFATGGIGGVHRGAELTGDISADLTELSRTRLIVVSAGAKAILDLPRTLEMLETLSVPVLGYRTDEFPAFYSRGSGVPIPRRVESAGEIAAIFNQQWALELSSALLVANPISAQEEIAASEIDELVNAGMAAACSAGISGPRLTPFLLQFIVDRTGGRSLKANRSLALNNIRLGAEIALALKSEET